MWNKLQVITGDAIFFVIIFNALFTLFFLTELTLATNYEMSVIASNAHGPSLEYCESIQAKTAGNHYYDETFFTLYVPS